MPRRHTHLCPIDLEPIYRPDQNTCSKVCQMAWRQMTREEVKAARVRAAEAEEGEQWEKEAAKRLLEETRARLKTKTNSARPELGPVLTSILGKSQEPQLNEFGIDEQKMESEAAAKEETEKENLKKMR